MEEKDFERLLKVSRLKLSEREKKKIKADIDDVINYFNKIDKVDAKASPAYQPIHIPTKFRKDNIIPFPDVDLLKKSSKLHDGYIVGPKL